MANNSKKVVVVGAGIVGASSALWLRRSGCDVTLIDRTTPGMGASFGNACLLASCAVIPVTTPGIIRKAPGYLLNRDFPLFVRLGYLPQLIPWLRRYLGYATDADTRRIAQSLTTIIGDSVEQHKALSEDTAAAKWIVESDYLFAYQDRLAFDADHYSWSLRRNLGFVPELIEGAAVQEREPVLSKDTKLLAIMPEHGYILNPAGYVKSLVETFTGMGGNFVQTEVRDFEMSGGKINAVLTEQGRFSCERVVISSGIWSKPLMGKLGLNVPLEAERGYHIVFKNPSIQPRSPMMINSAKFVATPMDQGLRCAGVVEFGGLSEKRSKAPLALLRRKVAEVFPDMTADSEEEWMGFRPSTPDSLPMIGEVGTSGVYTAFGHQHVGLTGGAKTGRLVADLIGGRHPNIDMSPFEPKRFT